VVVVVGPTVVFGSNPRGNVTGKNLGQTLQCTAERTQASRFLVVTFSAFYVRLSSAQKLTPTPTKILSSQYIYVFVSSFLLKTSNYSQLADLLRNFR
jgi:hypothetical protein